MSLSANRTCVLNQPIFIVGAGRSGSSVFANTLAKHPDIAFLTIFSHRYPHKAWLNRSLLRLLDVPGCERFFMADVLKLSEAYGFWAAQDPGFRRPMRDLMSSDVTEAARRALRNSLSRLLTSRRERFMAKLTGWPRIGYLNEVFPDATFIHLVRDGRNVATSFLKLTNWRGWEGPTHWRFGPLPPELEKEWERSDRSFVVLAGLHWRLILDAVEAAREYLPHDRFVEVRYEDFVRQPIQTYRRVVDQCGLEWNRRFEKSVRRTAIGDAGEKWKSDLSEHQQRLLTAAIREHLSRYGYEPEGRDRIRGHPTERPVEAQRSDWHL